LRDIEDLAGRNSDVQSYIMMGEVYEGKKIVLKKMNQANK